MATGPGNSREGNREEVQGPQDESPRRKLICALIALRLLGLKNVILALQNNVTCDLAIFSSNREI